MSEGFQVQFADNEAIQFVLNNLWDRGEAELEIMGIPKVRAAEMIIERRERGEPTFSFRVDGVPIFIAGLTRADDPSAMATWFQATDDFNAYAREITQRLRVGVEASAKTYGLKYVEIFSPCVHPKTGRWFKALGFDLDVNYHQKLPNGAKLYRFVRNFDGGGNVLPQA